MAINHLNGVKQEIRCMSINVMKRSELYVWLLEVLRKEMVFKDMALDGIIQPVSQMKKRELRTDFWESFLFGNLTKGVEKK